MVCANCGNSDEKTLFDEGDTFYCSLCKHRTRVSDGQDDLVECPVCGHLRDRKAAYCSWCNSLWGSNDKFDQEAYESANEFEKSVSSSNLRYFKLLGKSKKRE